MQFSVVSIVLTVLASGAAAANGTVPVGTAYTYPGYGSYPTAVAQAQAASNSTGNSTAGAGAVAGAGSTGTIISLPSRTPSASALATYEGSAARVGGSALGLVIAGGIALML